MEQIFSFCKRWNVPFNSVLPHWMEHLIFHLMKIFVPLHSWTFIIGILTFTFKKTISGMRTNLCGGKKAFICSQIVIKMLKPRKRLTFRNKKGKKKKTNISCLNILYIAAIAFNYTYNYLTNRTNYDIDLRYSGSYPWGAAWLRGVSGAPRGTVRANGGWDQTPSESTFKRVRMNMWGKIRLYEVKDIWIMVVRINIRPSLHSFTLCLIPFCEVKDIWIMVVWINARLSTNYICFVLSYFQTCGDLLHLCRNHGCPWWLVNCWLLNVNPLVKSS